MQVRVIDWGNASNNLTKCYCDIIMQDLKTGGKLMKKIGMLIKDEIEVFSKLKERNLRKIVTVKEISQSEEYIKGYTDALNELNEKIDEELKILES